MNIYTLKIIIECKNNLQMKIKYKCDYTFVIKCQEFSYKCF